MVSAKGEFGVSQTFAALWANSWAADAVGRSDLSGAAEADGHLAILDDHGNLSPAMGELHHALETSVVFQDIDIVKRNFAPGEVRTGSRSKSSQVLAVDRDVFCHGTIGGRPVTLRSVNFIKLSVAGANCKCGSAYVSFVRIYFEL